MFVLFLSQAERNSGDVHELGRPSLNNITMNMEYKDNVANVHVYTVNSNIYLLLDVFLCRSAEYFELCRILTSPKVESKYKRVKILSDTTQQMPCKIFIIQHAKLLCPCGQISNRSSGVQISRYICTHFGRYCPHRVLARRPKPEEAP